MDTSVIRNKKNKRKKNPHGLMFKIAPSNNVPADCCYPREPS